MEDSKKPDAKKARKGCLIFAIFVAIVSIIVLLGDENKPSEPLTPEQIEAQAKEARKNKIESQFSAWTGANVWVERAIKKAMNDPGSYEHVETRYWDMKDYLVIKTKFRGRNGFGGMVLLSVYARVDLEGTILEIRFE